MKVLVILLLIGLIISAAAAFGQDQQRPGRSTRIGNKFSGMRAPNSSILENLERTLQRVFGMIKKLRTSKNTLTRNPARSSRAQRQSTTSRNQSQKSSRKTRSSQERQIESQETQPTDSVNVVQLLDWAIKKYTKKGIQYKAFEPYNEKAGFSCSAFTSVIAKKAGVNLPSFSPLQFKMGQQVLSKSALKAGDLLFWRFPTDKEYLRRPVGVPNHVGFYLGNGMILHSSGGKGPNVMKMTPAYERFFIGGRRIFNVQQQKSSNLPSQKSKRSRRQTSTQQKAKRSIPVQRRRRQSSINEESNSSDKMTPRELMNWAVKKYTGKGIPYKATPPYNEKLGFGCSPFTSAVAKKVGVNLPAYSPSQFQMGKKISYNDMQVGDLVFWRFPTTQAWLKRPVGVPNHVGFYLGNGKILHSSGGRGPNVMQMTNSYRQYFIGARRILPQ